MSQAELRQQLLQRRQRLSATQCAADSAAICAQIISSQDYQQAQAIAAYLAVGNEVCLQAVLDNALQAGKQVYLPRLHGQAMQFARYSGTDELRRNRFGIAEPAPTQPDIAAAALDIIYLPLVGFDAQCQRIGMGGGYYDRALAEVQQDPRPQRIGVAYKEQATADCFANPWDVPLHQVITP